MANLHIILHQPQIPQNTGNIGRLCAFTKLHLHLIHPLGFKITDKQLKRSGMDYWEQLDITHYDNWQSFADSKKRPERVWLLTTKAKKSYWDVQINNGDGLLFGNEGHGLPENIHRWAGDEFRITIPSYNDKLRSLNLATSVGIAAYEALRQLR